MSLKRTLWQRWMSPKQNAPPTPQRFNPLKARIGSSITINLPEHSGEIYTVSETKEVVIRKNGKDHKYVDYVVADGKGRIRYLEEGNLLLLEMYDEMPFTEEFLKILQKENEFHVTDNENNTEDIFWRIGDQKKSHECFGENEFKEILHGPGGVCHDKVEPYKMEMWDYSRMTKDDADQSFEQYLFVEMDKNSGRFQIWIGKEVEKERVRVM